MKAIAFKKLNWLVFGILVSLLAGSHVLLAQDQSTASASDLSKRLTAIEKKLNDAEKRQQQILEGQAKILEEVLRSRTWLSHRG